MEISASLIETVKAPKIINEKWNRDDNMILMEFINGGVVNVKPLEMLKSCQYTGE